MMIRVTSYSDGTTLMLNTDCIEKIEDVYGREWRSAIAMINAPPGDRWHRARESAKDIQAQMQAVQNAPYEAAERLLREAVIRADNAERERDRASGMLRLLIEAQDAIDRCVTDDEGESPPYQTFYDALDEARAWLEEISGE